LIKSRIALKFAIAIKDDNGIATCYNTIAATFDELSEPDKASSTIKRTGICKQNTNDKLKNWLYNNLGNIYCFDKRI
jgi:hypothetical protein